MELKGLHLYLTGEPPEVFKKWSYGTDICKIPTMCRIYLKGNKSRDTFWGVSVLIHLLERSVKI